LYYNQFKDICVTTLVKTVKKCGDESLGVNNNNNNNSFLW